LSGSDNSKPNRHNSPVAFTFADDESLKHVEFMTGVQNAINNSDAAWVAYHSLVHAISANKPNSDVTKRRMTLTKALVDAKIPDESAQRATKIIADNTVENLQGGGHGGPA
jgi:hypothetical protein